MVTIRQNLVEKSKYRIKCPYTMEPQGVAIHNTANDAPAANEIAYMKRNNNQVSFHYAVDDFEAVQGIPEDRNAWHAGDGHGDGNRKYISIEICYSQGGGKRFDKAEKNAAELAAALLKKYGFGIERLKKHQDFNGKYCPHRTLDYGWERFVNMVKAHLDDDAEQREEANKEEAKDEKLYRVQVGAYSVKKNATEKLEKVKAAGFDTYMVKAGGLYKIQVGAFKKKANADKMLEIVEAAGFSAFITTESGEAATNAEPARLSVDEIAKQVIAGEWGNGDERKKLLKAAGYNYDAVQKRVNELL